MGTTAQKLQALADAKAQIKAAIIAKGVQVGDDFSEYATGISQIRGGGQGQSDDVVFVDCDGTVLHSYSADEISQMESLPDTPTRDGLVCQGWNYTLQELQSFVQSSGRCTVGAVYSTDLGYTEIKITVSDAKYSSVTLYWNQTDMDGLEIDWGDDTGISYPYGTGNRSLIHEYQV